MGIHTNFLKNEYIVQISGAVFYVIHFAAGYTLYYSTDIDHTLPSAQQVAGIGSTRGGPARAPGKNALTFDHILNRLQKNGATGLRVGGA